MPGLRCTGDAGTVLSGDPWLSFGPDGLLYLTTGTDVGGSDPFGLDRHVKVLASRSTDGGETWSRAAVVEGPTDFNDKMTVTADPHRSGQAWIVFTKGRPPDYVSGDLYISQTRDGGRTWSAARRIFSTLGARVPMYPWGNTLRVLPNGALLDAVMLWQPAGVTTVPLPQRGNYRAVTIRSQDGGATWSAPTMIASVPVGRVPAPGDGSGVRANQGVALDTASDGSAYAVWWQRGASGVGQVVLSRSTDGGSRWSRPRVVADATRSAFLPAVAAGRGRTVGVSYYDLRHDRSGDGALSTDAWFAVSSDGGGRWREVHLGGSFDLRSAASVDGEAFIGDYFGLAATRHGFGAVEVFARPLSHDGPSDVFYAPISVRRLRAARLRLAVLPRASTAGTRTIFHLRVTTAGARGSIVGVYRATIRFAGRKVRTDRRGRARIVATLQLRRYWATASKRGYSAAAVRIRVHARTRPRQKQAPGTGLFPSLQTE